MRLTLLSGGVGGAKLARGFAALSDHELTVIANVGDDDRIYGLAVSPDIDTIIYTMAGREGPQGWGLADDPFAAMKALDSLPIDATFRIGDSDLATNLFRTDRFVGWVVAHLGDDRAGVGLRDRGHHPPCHRRPAENRDPGSR